MQEINNGSIAFSVNDAINNGSVTFPIKDAMNLVALAKSAKELQEGFDFGDPRLNIGGLVVKVRKAIEALETPLT